MRWVVCLALAAPLVLQIVGESLNSGDECMTPFGTAGFCDPVRNCSYVRRILQSPNYTHLDSSYLETLKCGEMNVPNRKKPLPLICCPKFSNEPTCGGQSIADRIYFGEETELGEHPWAGLLFYNIGRNRTLPKCGGALVSKRYVITAAHCTVDKPNWKLLYVRFNEFNTSSPENCTTVGEDNVVCREDYAVESIIPHPQYDMTNVSRPNDICILRLAMDVTYHDYIRPICLPFSLEVQNLPIALENFTVTGWGETEEKRPSATQKHVELPGLENEDCNSVYAVANVTLTDKQLCIGGLNGSDSCRGDSGGPLMRQHNGGWFLIGVVSFGARFCGTVNLPGVYTNVIKYLDWMESIMFVDKNL
ncbi:CLIP domain-containing serine protease B15-like [Anopheles nili]|uniref:CLIP domain-containing serine protease B15-like n=1 Tax=Anopheles nili TaxID=185578 RepID=UPI00237AFAE2|nr:CLIP domain-containing serine protease B15-like [Anopheles nili]